MKCFVLLTVLVFASKNENDVESVAANEKENVIVVKIEEDEYFKEKSKSSKYFGVSYHENYKSWIAQRWSKMEKKILNNGTYKDEETAAHASDTLARKLMTNGEQNHKLNFPDDNTEVYPDEETKTSKYFGVHYNEKHKRWVAQRWSKDEGKNSYNGTYKDEKMAAHASDTLARKLMANGKQNLELNFPDECTEVYGKTSASQYFGVSYVGKTKKWLATRWNKHRPVYNGYYKDEETAAHASDTLARILMANGEQNLKLNFPGDKTEVHKPQKNKRKRSFDFGYSQANENSLEKFEEK